MYFNDHLHWAPRFGSAYRMGDHMVFRGGYGVFVMAYHLNHLNTLHLNPPNASVQLTNPATPMMTIASPFPAALVSSRPGGTSIRPGPRPSWFQPGRHKRARDWRVLTAVPRPVSISVTHAP
jgi:hypothetical protein